MFNPFTPSSLVDMESWLDEVLFADTIETKPLAPFPDIDYNSFLSEQVELLNSSAQYPPTRNYPSAQPLSSTLNPCSPTLSMHSRASSNEFTVSQSPTLSEFTFLDLLDGTTNTNSPLCNMAESPIISDQSALELSTPASGVPSVDNNGAFAGPQPSPAAARPVRKTGPGRPSKAETAVRMSPGARRSQIIKSRQLHNVSASRSRARFSAVLDELWLEIPKSERARVEELEGLDQRQVSRAEKIETAILFVRKLQRTLGQ